MEHALSLLRLLYDVADSIPVVGLKPAVAVTLHILEIANQVKSNKDDCLQLANRAADIMCLVYEELKRQDGCNPENLQERINDLEGVLRNIEAYMERKSRERFLKRLFSRYSIVGDIQQFTVKLNDAVVAFQLTSMIDVSHTAAQIKQNLDTLTDNASQQTEVILAQIQVTDSKLDKLSSISLGSVTYAENVEKFCVNDFVLTDDQWVSEGQIEPGVDTCIVSSVARMRKDNQRVVVKRFPNQDPRFKADLERLKNLWHPNIARVIGCSRSQVDSPFIIKESTEGSMNSLLDSLTGYRLIAFNIKVLRQIASISEYLDKLGFERHTGITAFSVSRIADDEGHIVVDIDKWKNNKKFQIPHGLFGYVDIPNCNFTSNQGADIVDSMISADLASSPSPLRNLRHLCSLVQQWNHIAFTTDMCLSVRRDMRTFSPGIVFTATHGVASECIALSPQIDSLSGIVTTTERHEVTACDAFIKPSWEVPAGDHLAGWIRYTVQLRDLCPSGQLRITHQFKKYSLQSTHPWLMENALFIASSHEVKAETVCLVRGYEVYITAGLPYENNNPRSVYTGPLETLYFFARTHIWNHECLDTRPWGYWSVDGDVVPPADSLHMPPPDWQERGLEYIGWKTPGTVLWEQAVNGMKFSIQVTGSLHYDNLDMNEVHLLEEVQKWRTTSGSTENI